MDFSNETFIIESNQAAMASLTGGNFASFRKFDLSHNFFSEVEDLYQVALLVDQLKHDDVQLRVAAFNSLERIGIRFTMFLV